MKTVCEKDLCAGCMACTEVCPKGAITIKDSLSAYNAVIDTQKCIDCAACHRVCQQNHPAKVYQPKVWYQGWAQEPSVRANGSSGGAAGAIAQAFLDTGGIVCSCTFKDGSFIFDFVDSKEDLLKFAGSKYVKSNPAGVYNRIKTEIDGGRAVLMIGLPCQISAARNFIGAQLSENFYAIDLICHGTSSPKVLNLFLKQYGYKLKDFSDITFRVKDQFQIKDGYKGIITNGVMDKYSIAFLNAQIYTENCYACPYAQEKRTGDVTLGDSWGTSLPGEEFKKGISLILCQTDKGVELVENAALHLKSVDLERAIENNHQLQHPSIKPKGWEVFFHELKAEKNFNKLVSKYLPMQCTKQDVKQALIRTGLRKSGGGTI